MGSFKKYNTTKSILIIIILLFLPVYLLKQHFFGNNANSDTTPHYVGKEACIECHQAEFDDWTGSDHDLAMDIATDSTVLGDFNNAVLVANNQTNKFYKRDNKFYVYTDGEDGKMKEFEVKYVFGYTPLQQYLVEFAGGRLQTLALTWNTLKKNWYYMPDSTYKGMNVDHTNWLHWTNQAQNWNSMCADCHSTNIKKNYDLKTDSYHTTFSEIDVSCEACHGPASEHLKWANLADYARKDFKNYGLPVKTSGIDNIQYVNNCVRCHSRRVALGDFDPLSPTIYNHTNPAVPAAPVWYIDGQIKEEDYVYASFTQSRMFMNDVQCNDCHNVHSGKLVLEGNKLCLQCHRASDYDTPTHTHHKNYGEKGDALISAAGVHFEVGSGTQCINCHMHGQNFMGVDYRRDHSFRIPRPDLSEKNGTPNACNQCHTNKSNKWASNYIEKWFGTSRPYQYGEAFSAAINGDKDADKNLRKIITDDLYPTNIRAIAIQYLSDSTENKTLLTKLLHSIEPELRMAAINRFNIDSGNDIKTLLPLLYDETKAVRFEAINRLSFVDLKLIPKNYRAAYKKAETERLNILKYNADFPTGKFNLANFYYQNHDYKNAEHFFLATIKQDREIEMAKLNLANLYSAMGKPKKAEKILADFVKENPENGMAVYNYGLILSENRKYKKSLKYLVKASELNPDNSRVDYNTAMLYDFFGEKAKAEEYLKKAIRKDDSNFANYSNLLQFYNKNNQKSKAKKLTAEIEKKFPNRF